MTRTRYPGISRRADGRYHVRVTVQIDGRRIYRKKTLEEGATLAEARREVEQLRVEAQEKPRARITVDDYVERWLEDRAERVAASTADLDAQVFADFILPVLGECFVDELVRADIDAWVRYVEALRKQDGTPFSHETTKTWWRKLCLFVRDAVADGHLDRDPTLRVRPPKKQRGPQHERETLSAEQLRDLLEAVRARTSHRYAEVLVLAFTGMRPGELYALRWEDVEDDVLWIRRSHWRGVVGRTKTGDPRRVPLPRLVHEELRRHRHRLVAVQHPGLASGLVFPPDRGARYRHYSSLQKPLEGACRAAGIDIKVTPRVLRRTFDTLMVAHQVDRLVLRSLMGHTSERMTERYLGVPVEMQRAAVMSLADAVQQNTTATEMPLDGGQSVAPECGPCGFEDPQT